MTVNKNNHQTRKSICVSCVKAYAKMHFHVVKALLW